MVTGDEVFLFQFLPDDEFRFYPAGTDLCDAQVFSLRCGGVAVAVHPERYPSFEYRCLELLHTRFQTGKFLVVPAPGHIEHILFRHETEKVGRI